MKKLVIVGMPRSGTSWLGQIIGSSPRVLIRTEPLFSYKHKNTINKYSSKKDILNFFEILKYTDDEFILQSDKISKGYYPYYRKDNPNILAFKTTRHFELLGRYLGLGINVIAIVRNPCAVINSWINSYREFEKKGCHIEDDWYSGACRKGSIGEYWGFYDWIQSTHLFEELDQKFENFKLLRYEDLLHETHSVSGQIFTFLESKIEKETLDFIESCHSRHDEDPYSVFKDPHVAEHSWKNELPPHIIKKIKKKANEERLTHYLNE